MGFREDVGSGAFLGETLDGLGKRRAHLGGDGEVDVVGASPHGAALVEVRLILDAQVEHVVVVVRRDVNVPGAQVQGLALGGDRLGGDRRRRLGRSGLRGHSRSGRHRLGRLRWLRGRLLAPPAAEAHCCSRDRGVRIGVGNADKGGVRSVRPRLRDEAEEELVVGALAAVDKLLALPAAWGGGEVHFTVGDGVARHGGQWAVIHSVETAGDAQCCAGVGGFDGDVDVAHVFAVDRGGAHGDVGAGKRQGVSVERWNGLHAWRRQNPRTLPSRGFGVAGAEAQRCRHPAWRGRRCAGKVDGLELGGVVTEHLIPRSGAAGDFALGEVEAVDEELDMAGVVGVTGVKGQRAQHALLRAFGRRGGRRNAECRCASADAGGGVIRCNDVRDRALGRIGAAYLPGQRLGCGVDKRTVLHPRGCPVGDLVEAGACERGGVVGVGAGVDPG